MPYAIQSPSPGISKIVSKTLIPQVVAALFPIVMVSNAPNISESFRNVGA